MISGCPLNCVDCHSKEYKNGDLGTELTCETLSSIIAQYEDIVTCVVFLGGEWDEENLVKLLDRCRENDLKTCLYTGMELHDFYSDDIMERLDYMKVGPYKKDLGGLNSRSTNQIMYDFNGRGDITEIFWK